GVHQPNGTLEPGSADGSGIQNGSPSDVGGASTLTVNGLTLDTSILNFDLDSLNSATIDPVTRIPGLEVGTVNIGDQSEFTAPGTYTLINYRGIALLPASSFSLGVVSPAPEPSGTSLLLLGAGALLRRRRRDS